MISLILISIAAFFNSVMDKLVHHFGTSIFRGLNQNFWNPNVSWATAKKFMGYKFDAWHIAKSLMIFCLCFAIVLYQPITEYWFFDWAILGTMWNIVFVLFYDKILKK